MVPMKACARGASIAVLFLSLVTVGCDRPAERDPIAAPPAADPAHDSIPEPAAEPEPAGNPLQALAPADQDDATFGGVVRERLPAGGYTYLRVATEEGDRWVATMGKGAPVGQRVLVKNMGTRHDFHSKRLGRRFDAIAFGIVREA